MYVVLYFIFVSRRRLDVNVINFFNLRPRLHCTGLHRSVVIFIPDSGAVYTTPDQESVELCLFCIKLVKHLIFTMC